MPLVVDTFAVVNTFAVVASLVTEDNPASLVAASLLTEDSPASSVVVTSLVVASSVVASYQAASYQAAPYQAASYRAASSVVVGTFVANFSFDRKQEVQLLRARNCSFESDALPDNLLTLHNPLILV